MSKKGVQRKEKSEQKPARTRKAKIGNLDHNERQLFFQGHKQRKEAVEVEPSGGGEIRQLPTPPTNHLRLEAIDAALLLLSALSHPLQLLHPLL